MCTAEDDDPDRDTERRISEAACKNAKVLNLSGSWLTAVPDSVRLLTSLTQLNLSANRLTTVPDWIGQLTSLTRLNLAHNRLTAVPDEIGQLTSLTKLKIANNPHLSSPPPKVAARGTHAVLAFLRARAT